MDNTYYTYYVITSAYGQVGEPLPESDAIAVAERMVRNNPDMDDIGVMRVTVSGRWRETQEIWPKIGQTRGEFVR